MSVSLYQVQKFLFDINRNPGAQDMFRCNRAVLLDQYEITVEERHAIETSDIGLLYVLGANGQLLMHFAAFLGMSWANYLAAMRNGVEKFGPVRAGIYAMTTAIDEKVAGV